MNIIIILILIIIIYFFQSQSNSDDKKISINKLNTLLLLNKSNTAKALHIDEIKSTSFLGSLFTLENMENVPLDIGNFFCIYFSKLGYSFKNGDDFAYDINQENEFLKHLPTKIPYDPIIGNSLKYIPHNIFNIGFDGTWVCDNNNIYDFWIILKPLINNILNEAFIKADLQIKTQYPVIHFRCSDVPFIKHFHYHIVKYQFYLDALNELKTKNINTETVNLLACFSHLATGENKKHCNIYIESLNNFLIKNGYKVNIICNSNIDDFALLFYAPAVISLGSSYSFMSGFFGNGIFISEGHFDERITESSSCNKCNWLKNSYTLLHKNVGSYHDSENIIKLLN
jgi:hypothetical protein